MKCKNCKNLINGWCEKKLDSPAPETERKCGDYEVKTHYDRIKQMSIDEMAEFIVKSKKIFVEDAYKGISETLNKQKKFKGYSIEIDNSKVADWEIEEFEIQKQWLLQEVEENDR